MGRLIYTNAAGQEISVPFGQANPIVTIGRATDCTIQCNRKSVSRRHAQFLYNHGTFEVVDLNSSNGTYLIVNETRQPVKPRISLTHNDEIWCGDFILYFYEEGLQLADADSDPTQNAMVQDFIQPPQNGYGNFPQNHQPNPQQNPYQPQQNPYQQPGFAEPNPYGVPQSQPNNATPSVGFGHNPQQPVHVPLDPFGAEMVDVQPYHPDQADPFNQSPTPPPTQGRQTPAQPFQAEPFQVEPYQPDAFQAEPFQVEPYKPDAFQAEPYQAEPYQPDAFQAEPYQAEPYQPDAFQAEPFQVEPYQPEPYQPDPFAPQTAVESAINIEPYQAMDVYNPIEPVKENWQVDQNIEPLNITSEQDAFEHMQASIQPQPVDDVEKKALEDVISKQTQELESLKKQLRIKTKELETARSTSSTSNDQSLVELESARQEQRRLEEKLHTALQNAAKGQEYQEELQQLQLHNNTTELRLEEALAQVESLASQSQNVEHYATQLNQLRKDLQVSQDDRDLLRQQNQEVQESLSRAQSNASQSQQAEETAESLRRELDRSKRLLEEFEQRNRTLQTDLDQREQTLHQLRTNLENTSLNATTLNETASAQESQIGDLTNQKNVMAQELAKLRTAHETLTAQHGEQTQKLTQMVAQNETLTSQISTLAAQHNELTEQRNELHGRLEVTQNQLDTATPTIRSLHQEVEGLKQRVLMEKDRAKKAKREFERLQTSVTNQPEDNRAEEDAAQIESLHEQLTAAQVQAQTQAQESMKKITALEQVISAQNTELEQTKEAPTQSIDPQWFSALGHEIEKLSRVVDAIERLDLSTLGPVDRVRLRSALKDTTPAKTLEQVFGMIEQEST